MEALTAKVFTRIADIAESDWSALTDERATPFVSWGFLEALESSGSAVPEAGWLPQHLTLWRGERLIAAAPAYLKGDSTGDFSRDWGWQHIAAQMGARYYPKLIIGVPFTPVPGRRMLVASDEDRDACTAALVALARELTEAYDLASIHVLFCDETEVAPLESAGLFSRALFQFHWHNRGYQSTSEWLATLNSKKRNQAKRERAEIARKGFRIRTIRNGELTQRDSNWARDIYRLYRRTCDRFMWGHPYLTQAFFETIFGRLPEHVEVVEATRQGDLVAAAFNLSSPTRLFGRYWGSFEEHRFLHFSVCLYHSVEDCIERGIRVFEGGMDGQHKLARGFEPVLVHSAHAFVDPRLNETIRKVCRLEKQARSDELDAWRKEKRKR